MLLYRYSCEVQSFVVAENDRRKVVFPEKWTRTHFAASRVETDSPMISFDGGGATNSSTFTLLEPPVIGEAVRGSMFEPPLPSDMPVIPKAEYYEWKRNNVPTKK